jgi:MerR family redox-sensitive transcriptional activator SoxR
VAHELTIGELSTRSGVAQSALRFYERQGLIASSRTDGNQRRYASTTLRRVALIRAGKAAGIPLERLREALDTLGGDSPKKKDWERLSRAWAGDPRPADRLHRLRMPLTANVSAAQPGRRGSSARRWRALLA